MKDYAACVEKILNASGWVILYSGRFREARPPLGRWTVIPQPWAEGYIPITDLNHLLSLAGLGTIYDESGEIFLRTPLVFGS